jgi:hypothetical protein
VTTSLIPYTRSAIPNNGETIIAIDKIMANALERVLAVCPLFFSSLFPPLRPAIMLEMPLNSKAMAASNTTNAAEARGYAITMLERIMTNIPRPIEIQ